MQGRSGGRGHSATCGRENEEERGVLRRGRGSSSGRRCCGATAEGDGARLTRRELLTGGAERKQGRAAVAGCGRVRQRGGIADTRDPAVSGRGREERRGARVGRPRKRTKWAQPG
jgi:hypothetical protein